MSRHRRQTLGGRTALIIATMLVWLTACSGSQQESARGSVFLTSAQALDNSLSDSLLETPPRHLSDDAWRTIDLPRAWSADSRQPASATSAWYRMPLPAQAYSPGWRHLLILRHMMNMEVWLDDHYLGSAGDVRAGNMQRNWNRPVMWVLPDRLVATPPQMLYFRLYSAPSFGVMSPAILGDRETIVNRYRLNSFLQIELVKISLLAMMFIAFLGVFVWFRVRQRHWLLISLMSLSWSLPLFYILLPTVPAVLPGEFDFLRLSHWGTVAGALCLLAFIYSFYLGVAMSRLRWLSGVTLLHGAVLLVVPDTFVVFAGSVGQSLVQLLFVLLIAQLLRARALRNAEVFSIIIGLVIMLLAAAHDVSLALSNSMERWRWDMFVSYITQPVMMMIVAWHGIRAFLNSVRELDEINGQLQQRLTKAEQSLREVFSQQLKLQRENHLAAEREQVYRDLHDDLGARLLSLVFKSGPGDARDLARSALQDLRDIVSRVMQEDHQLAAVIADSMAENDSRASALGKAFSWHADAALEAVICSNRRMLKLRLLLRELCGYWMRQPQILDVVLNMTLTGRPDVPVLQIDIRCSGDVSDAGSDSAVSWPPLLRKRLQALEADCQPGAGGQLGMTLWIPMPVMVTSMSADAHKTTDTLVPD